MRSEAQIAAQADGTFQGDLEQAGGLTFQQIQKYERGVNRISASRLVEFASCSRFLRPGFLRACRRRTLGQADAVAAGVQRSSRKLANRETVELFGSTIKSRIDAYASGSLPCCVPSRWSQETRTQ
jgi:hypothetical protein